MDYESIFIVSPELSTEKIEELVSKAVKVVETAKGTVTTVQQFGKKKLAYLINKFREGNYVYMELNGNGQMVNALENFFKFNDSVIRFLTIKIEKKKIIAKPTSKAEHQAAEPQAAEEKQNEPATK